MATEVRNALQQQISNTLLPMIGPHADRIHLLDPPDHPNVGDCAILLGELDFFDRELPKGHVAFTDWTQQSRSRRAIEDSSILLIHGGGNFGDIWAHHHEFRLHVLRDFKHRKVVQLPQSIHFDSPAVLRETQDAIGAHPDFTLLTRDERSEAFAREHFDCRVELCPDMAFAMNPIHRRPPSADILCLLRTDKEVAVQPDEVMRALETTGLSLKSGDWLDDPRTPFWFRDRLFRSLATRAPRLRDRLSSQTLAARRAYARSRLNRGIELLSQGRIVVTDRLHGHIISLLLGIPNLVFNSYDAKATALYESWTHADPSCRLVRSPAELPDAIRAITGRSTS
ncbi:MAG: polysaccharide pyruvyl transferase family protein [Erythrobacter sp.]|nr:polysaccharide pyruvyl transferase family protein [Erythrobacter sp.]